MPENQLQAGPPPPTGAFIAAIRIFEREESMARCQSHPRAPWAGTMSLPPIMGFVIHYLSRIPPIPTLSLSRDDAGGLLIG
jgi:hypothetical protein